MITPESNYLFGSILRLLPDSTETPNLQASHDVLAFGVHAYGCGSAAVNLTHDVLAFGVHAYGS